MTKESVFSSNRAIRGAFIEDVFRMASHWDFELTPQANYKHIESTNCIGAASSGWLRQFLKSVKSRYDFAGSDRALIELVQSGWHIEDWRPILLWHMSRTDDLLRRFMTDWLYANYTKGIVVLTIDHTVEYLHRIVSEVVGSDDAWTPLTFRRVAGGLLKTATDFQILRGNKSKEFASYRLPDRSFVYLLHVLMEREQNTKKMVEASDWKLFMLKPDMVEEELLRLHQYGQLRFERAGSFLELTLPSENLHEFIRMAGA